MKPTLYGERVMLRPLQAQDVAPLAIALQDPEVLKLTGSEHGEGVPAEPRDPAHDSEFLRWRMARTDRLDLAVVDRESGECVGEVVLNQWDEDNQSCNFRTFIGPSGRGRGLGTEATKLIVGYGFENLGLHRISLEVYAFNPRARRVYEKVGFVVEGVLRDALRYADGWVDATVMSILATEWNG